MAGWEVCISCNPASGRQRPKNRESVTQKGVCTHLGASLGKVNNNQKALPNLPV